MESGCSALEYAKGVDSADVGCSGMLRVSLRDALRGEMVTDGSAAFSNTLDFPTLWRTTAVTGREMIGNLLKGKLCISCASSVVLCRRGSTTTSAAQYVQLAQPNKAGGIWGFPGRWRMRRRAIFKVSSMCFKATQ